MVFFSSDIHLGDEENLRLDLRPFKNIKQFDKQIIKTWNKQANRNDTIYIIGDFADCSGEGHDTWKKTILNVKKIKANVILITGNHEERIIKHYFNGSFDEFKKYCLAIGFKDVVRNLVLKIRDKEFYLVHKPYEHKKEYINLFGHIHSSGGLFRPYGINVCCDLFHYRLASEDDIFHLLEKKQKHWDTDPRKYQ